MAATRVYYVYLVKWYIVIDQECCTVSRWSGSQPPFHPSAVSNYSSTVGTSWSSHNEAFSCQLCSSGFQFHTQPSVSPLNGHHCPRCMRPKRLLSTPPTCRTPDCPLPLCVYIPVSFFFLSYAVAHSDTAPLIMSLFVSLPSPVPTGHRCFDVFPASPSCLAVHLCRVKSEF